MSQPIHTYQFKILVTNLILLFCCGAGSLSAQQELMLSQMPNVWHTNTINPSYFPADKRVAIGLPALSIDGSHSGSLHYNDFFRKENGKTLLDFGQAVTQLDDINTIQFRQRTETASVGIRLTKRFTVHAGHALRSSANVQYRRELIELLWSGNGQFIGQEVQIAPSIDFLNWQEIYAGASLDIGKVSFGARIKYLAGTTALLNDQDHNSMSVFTNPDVYQLRLRTDYGFSSYNAINSIDTSGYGFDLKTGSLTNQLKTENSGIAFDLGVTLRLTDKLTLQASALDLGGTINWAEGKYFRSQGDYEYTGVTIPGVDIINNADSLSFSSGLDSLNDIFQFNSTAASFQSQVPMRFYVGGSYAITKRILVGMSLYHEQSTDDSQTSVGASIHWTPIRFISVGALYNTRAKDLFGFQLTLRPGPVQLYVASDNLLGAIRLKETSSANVRLGACLAF